MAWDTVEKQMESRGVYFKLSDDGEAQIIVFVGEPVLRRDRRYGQERVQSVFPVLTAEGLRVWTVGKRLTSQIRTMWEKIQGKAVHVMRIGRASDIKTKYRLEIVDEPYLVRQASKITSEQIDEILNKVEGVIKDEEGGEQ